MSFLRANQETMVAQLHQFCGINSGSDHLPGLSLMHDVLKSAFSPFADECESHSFTPISTIDMTGNTILQSCGDLLYLRKIPQLTRRVLLSGHMDTVYAKDHPFQALKYINDNQLNGPGVADMKGGLVVMLHALQAFEQTPFAQTLGWDVIINADEEIGSPASGPFLTNSAKQALAALVYEPAMTPSGTLAKNRKGSGQLTLVATGRSAHAGRSFNEGRNAICFLAEAISAINALNGQKAGVTINVGKIAGGDALNVVPNKAVAKLDIRINHPDDEHWVQQEIALIVRRLQREGYALTVHGGFHRPVKRINAHTKELFMRVKHEGKALGLTLDWEDSGGCCDGNNLAQGGLAVLDTLGVRGGCIHSPDEFILIDSLVERAALSTLLLIDLAKKGVTS